MHKPCTKDLPPKVWQKNNFFPTISIIPIISTHKLPCPKVKWTEKIEHCLIKRNVRRNYMIAIKRRIFLGSILDDLWCRTRPSGTSFIFDASFRGGAVTGRVGNALDQNGSNALRNLCRNGPTIKNIESLYLKFKFNKITLKEQYWSMHTLLSL